ncbi:hypothetical protein GWI33_002567 [Rhynchophorus ferrugineus]|uniref:Germinal-center associated nuclear protein n=1 Tax=Rhynchophorus ferrugineus TaxID=354439 RepID=A0A834IRR4_RHYFE|nr:hypothetical protein GWI33_002567 [Rhynchophorus ferrugineus]
MDITENQYIPNFKIVCSDYPEEFELDRSLCKGYFREFGKVQRIIYKQKQRVIVIEFTNEKDYLNALENAGVYGRHVFVVQPFESKAQPVHTQAQTLTVKKKIRDKIDRKYKVSYVDNNEVINELAAMGGSSSTNDIVDLTEEDSGVAIKPKMLPRINRIWRKDDPKKKESIRKFEKQTKKKLLETAIKNNARETVKILTAEQIDMLKIMRSQALTVEDKYKVLDARDKLLRFNKKKSQLKSGPTVGTCTDMCPEKERLLREMKHQISLYEQDESGRHSMNHKKAVKQYSRSSADQESPLPHELRPVTVLQFTMDYLVHNFMDLCDTEAEVNIGEWYHFLWDRTRAIRKDITQQALCCQGAVYLVEQCARFHIHCSARLTSEDPSVFDHKINTENLTKCLQTLKYMYNDLQLKGEKCPNEAEFRAYVILLNLNDGNFMWEVQKLREDIQKSPEIRFALQIYSAIDKHNFVKFFKLIKSTTYLNACILMRYFIQVRVQALETLIKCFTPARSVSFYPLQELVDMLYFDDIEVAIDFLTSYGVDVNRERDQFFFDRNSFKIPEYPYVLERSALVESKRRHSVGCVISGKPLSPETYLTIQNHELHSSFDKDGFLIHDDLFDEIERRMEEKLLDDPDSRESTPERKITPSPAPTANPPQSAVPKRPVANIFNLQKKSDTESNFNQNIFSSQHKDTSIFAQTNTDGGNVFSQQKKENIFAASSNDYNVSKPKDVVNMDTVDVSTSKENIFKSVLKKTEPNVNIFSQPVMTQSSNIFGGVVNVTTTASEWKMPITTTVESNTVILQKENEIEPKKGGFAFNLKNQKPSEVPNIFAFGFKTPSTNQLDKKENDIFDSGKELEESGNVLKKKEDDAVQQKNKEKEMQLIMEAKAREEEERKRQAELRREEEIKALELQQREEIERKQKIENEKKIIANAVRSVLNELVDSVEETVKTAVLNKIKVNIKNRIINKVLQRWKFFTQRRLKRRKAMNCIPIWVHDKDVGQCAKELHSKSQDLTLSYMKRYKLGHPLDIPIVEDQSINKLNLFYLTYSSLRRRFCEIKEKWHQHIFWKVVISIPDVDEMINGLHKLEENLKGYINWELNKYGQTQYIEDHKTVTYCIEKQQGADVKSTDANGFIFVAKNFSASFKQRVYENLKHFGVYVKLPVIFIMEDISDSDEYLDKLKHSGVVSDYVIYSCNLNGQVLPSIIDNGLIFLAKKVEKYPPLEMDTFYSFILKHLCTEMWKKAESYAKWNQDYNCCMRNPSVLISLYNQGLDLISDVILDKKRKEYASFSETFKDYLPDRIPDFLPCDYRHFPTFWSDINYEKQLKDILSNLKLPAFLHNWPPHNETDLILSVSKYCTEIFKNPKGPYINILNVLKKSIKDESYDTILWTGAIEIIATEKLKEQNLELPKAFAYEDVFKTFIVVYDRETLNNYSTSEWFYRNNSLIEGFKKTIDSKYKNTGAKKRCLDINIDDDVLNDVINKAESMLRSPKNLRLENRKSMENLNRGIKDLEESIKVVKRMDGMRLFNRFLDS